MMKIRQERAMTLLEVLVAMVVFAMVVMYANAFMCNFIQVKRAVKNMTQATSIGNKTLDSLRLLPYDVVSSGTTMIDNKYNCQWNITTESSIKMKTVDLTVGWQALGRDHKVKLSTNISNK
ncbi:MAG: prepilin-type N-terminal cleavage/methylation domain-containing protein [Chitinivibrionales bacterium]|nr:prepilin-type N-terminal cleavage/methylation domain-containing protein [Chitinivibrionales bacterium]